MLLHDYADDTHRVFVWLPVKWRELHISTVKAAASLSQRFSRVRKKRPGPLPGLRALREECLQLPLQTLHAVSRYLRLQIAAVLGIATPQGSLGHGQLEAESIARMQTVVVLAGFRQALMELNRVCCAMMASPRNGGP